MVWFLALIAPGCLEQGYDTAEFVQFSVSQIMDRVSSARLKCNTSNNISPRRHLLNYSSDVTSFQTA